jgi:hypothetical protein
VTGLGNGDVLYWSNVGAVQQWVTGPTPTGDGQLQYWNTSSSGHWSLSAAATTTGQALVWNNSTLTWGPGAVPLVGDVSGTTASNQVVSLAGGQTLALTGGNFPVSGSILQYVTSGSTPSWTSGAAPTQNGQLLQWNGAGWAQSDSTAPSNGNTLIWNSSIAPFGKWTPGNITLAGDVTGSTSANTVIKLQNYPVNLTGIAHGEMLWWSNVSGYQQFVTGPQPITTGQYYAWDTTLGGGVGGWKLSSAGGGITNDAQYASNASGSVTTAAGVNPANLPSAVSTTAMSGFTKYQITASIGIRSTSATTAYMQIYNGATSALIGIPMAATLSANAVQTITNSIVVSTSALTSYSFFIFANVQNGTGTHTGAVITAIGIQ